MNYDEFKEALKQHIIEELAEQYGGVKVSDADVSKLQNMSYDGITVTAGNSSVGVTVNTEKLYQMYRSEGMEETLEAAVTNIKKGLDEVPEVDVENMLNYEIMKKKLITQMVPVKGNEELLKKIPHRRVEDLAVVYRFVVSENNNTKGTVLIRNEMLDKMNISDSQLYADAVNYGPVNHPAMLKTMNEIMEELIGPGFEDMMPSSEMPQMYVASNTEKAYGADVIMYPDFLEHAAEVIGEDFYILPSSVHEVLLVPESFTDDYHKLEDMVREVNDTQVAPEEQLSDVVYHYDSSDRVFERASEYENRKSREEEPAIISVLLVEPGRKPEAVEIEDSLESLQSMVEGCIETVYPFDDNAVVICNEEGKLNGLEMNRAIRDEQGKITDIISGKFLIAGSDEENGNFVSLTAQQMKKYSDVFRQPEAFIKAGRSIVSVPVSEKENADKKRPEKDEVQKHKKTKPVR